MKYFLVPLLLVIIIAGCESIFGTDERDVSYFIRGTAPRAYIVYHDENGDEQDAFADMYWTKHFKAEKGQYLYLQAAHITGQGMIEASIVVEGEVFKQVTTDSLDFVVTANGDCP